MALDVSSIQNNAPLPVDPARQAAGVQTPGTADLKIAIRDLEQVSVAFNRRLSFTLNEKLGQVVVKVIDVDTDKVIREIPPKELQHVYERIREVMGLLFDEKA
jgi:flagellar protein FlaG